MPMPPPKVRTINGVDYPRVVPCPDGFPPGWKGVEQSYSETSKSWGKTYVRYSSLDGKHKHVSTPRGVIKAHCEDHGLDFDIEYAKYEKAEKEKAEAKEREREARGLAKGQKREDMIAISRNHFGELNGETVFGFPGWRCRWDFLPDSQQTPKTFTDPEGREFKLLKDLECMLGTVISEAGGSVPSEMAAMIEAGKNNVEAHALFHTGSARARETEGSVELTADTSEVKIETKEQRLQRVSVKKAKRSKFERPLVLAERDDYEDWAIRVKSLSEPDAEQAEDIAHLWKMLTARGFLKKSKDSFDFMLCVEAVEQTHHKYGSIFMGVYFLKGVDDSDRPVYQGARVLTSSQNAIIGLDRYIYWSAIHERWEMGAMIPGKACLAYSIGDVTKTVSAQSWKLLRVNFPDAMRKVEPAVPISNQPATEPAAVKRLASKNDKMKTNKRELAADTKLCSKDGKDEKNEKDTSNEQSLEPTTHTSLASKDDKGRKRGTDSIADDDAGGITPAKASKISPPPLEAKDADVAQSEGDTYLGADGRVLRWDGVWHEEKIWTYEEANRNKRCGEDLAGPPPHWPPDVTVCPGKWQDWLPPGWGQCRKDEPSGPKTKYVSPEGKVLHSRKDVEKAVGRELNTSERIPDWPPWLPQDWGISSRNQGGKSKACFVHPNWKRFSWSKPEVEKCIADGKVNQSGGLIKFKPAQASSPASRS